jgi:azurin
MSIRGFVNAGALSMLVASAIVAQQPAAPAGGTDHVAAVKQSLQISAAALRQYQWVETTAVSIKGDEKSRTQANCYYGADGKVQKTPIAAAPAGDDKQKRGVRGKIVENKKEEMSASMQEAVALVKQYVPPDPARIQAAKDAGKLTVTPPDPQGGVQVVIKDYLKAGDSLTIGLNAATNVISSLTVATFTDSAKDAVGMEVSWGSLTDGTLYAATIHLDVAAQNLAVAIENTGHKKVGG